VSQSNISELPMGWRAYILDAGNVLLYCPDSAEREFS
jgi:hypothetical protein